MVIMILLFPVVVLQQKWLHENLLFLGLCFAVVVAAVALLLLLLLLLLQLYTPSAPVNVVKLVPLLIISNLVGTFSYE